MSGSNPLQSFFRKSKFQLTLPSGGKWWPKDAIQLNTNGTVDIMSMTATDDVKFKASESSVSGVSTYDLIKSCVPNIKMPEFVPSVDLDVLLLSIRRATYGDELTINAPVPNTKLSRAIKLNISTLLSDYAKDVEWDEDLTIVNENNEELKVKIVPNDAKSLFALTKTISKQNQIALKIAEGIDSDDEKMESLNGTIKSLSEVKLSSVVDCVTELAMGDYHTSDVTEIINVLKNLDVEYFNALQAHLTAQREKFAFALIPCTSTKDELAAGAPATWEAEITFAQSDFFKHA